MKKMTLALMSAFVVAVETFSVPAYAGNPFVQTPSAHIVAVGDGCTVMVVNNGKTAVEYVQTTTVAAICGGQAIIGETAQSSSFLADLALGIAPAAVTGHFNVEAAAALRPSKTKTVTNNNAMALAEGGDGGDAVNLNVVDVNVDIFNKLTQSQQQTLCNGGSVKHGGHDYKMPKGGSCHR